MLVRRGDGRVEHIESSGLPLGILESASYREESGRLEPGDLVVLYTDGVTEAEDPGGEEFGVERVAEVVAAADDHADAVCDRLLASVDTFTRGEPLQDDATLLVVERLDG
jgi:sigma-B regulation protein RsbU (phosphoserine phosphatase)